MNEHEELLVKALACLSEASKIQDPVVRDKVVELAYHAQQMAQAAIVPDVHGSVLNGETNPRIQV